MRLPIQAKPVKRPEMIQPHTTVHVEYRDMEGLASVRSRLTYGANYNDPPALRIPTYHRVKLTYPTCRVRGWF
jgi:cyanobactin biosynthesis protein (PatB/AcyB/McaB family)